MGFLTDGEEAYRQEIATLTQTNAELLAECERLRSRLLMAAGDDQCRFTPDELRDIAGGKMKLPPKPIFLPSCEAFHDRHSSEHGVLTNCLTLAQALAESEKLRIENERLREACDGRRLIIEVLESVDVTRVARIEELEKVVTAYNLLAEHNTHICMGSTGPTPAHNYYVAIDVDGEQHGGNHNTPDECALAYYDDLYDPAPME